MKEIITHSPKRGTNIVMVDDEDYDFLMQWKWHLNEGGYVQRQGKMVKGKRNRIAMHRVLMNAIERKDMIDHKDRNKLNNQKSNLRRCNHSQNATNRIFKNNTSKYRGVCFSPPKKTAKTYKGGWRAYICFNKIRMKLGTFRTQEEAAAKYNEYAIKLHGSFAMLNIIEKQGEANPPV